MEQQNLSLTAHHLSVWRVLSLCRLPLFFSYLSFFLSLSFSHSHCPPFINVGSSIFMQTPIFILFFSLSAYLSFSSFSKKGHYLLSMESSIFLHVIICFLSSSIFFNDLKKIDLQLTEALGFNTLFIRYYSKCDLPPLRPHCREAPGRDSNPGRVI